MSKLTAAYVAGLIDGEGCLDLARQKRIDMHGKIYYRPRLRICLTEKEIIEWLQKSFGGNITTRKGQNNNKDTYSWSILGKKRLLPFLRKVYPYLKIKRRQAEILVKCFKTQDSENYTRNPFGYFPKLNEGVVEKREELYWKIRQFNQRGKFVQLERLKKATPFRGCDSLNL